MVETICQFREMTTVRILVGFMLGGSIKCINMKPPASDLKAAIKRVQDGETIQLDIPVVCVRIDELRKRVGNKVVLRSTSESLVGRSATTTVIVTEYVPNRIDRVANSVVYTVECTVQNWAPVSLTSLGTEMSMAPMIMSQDASRPDSV